MWGTFEDEEGILHCMPINEKEEPCAPHIFSQYCPCEPEVVIEDGEAMLVHTQIH